MDKRRVLIIIPDYELTSKYNTRFTKCSGFTYINTMHKTKIQTSELVVDVVNADVLSVNQRNWKGVRYDYILIDRDCEITEEDLNNVVIPMSFNNNNDYILVYFGVFGDDVEQLIKNLIKRGTVEN